MQEQFERGRWRKLKGVATIRLAGGVLYRAEDLEVRKLYEVIQDAASAQHGHLRVVDESGEDYLYPEEFFAVVEVPEETERALASRSAPAR